MMRTTGLFSFLIIAVFAAHSAVAELASASYVREIVAGLNTNGTGNAVTSISVDADGKVSSTLGSVQKVLTGTASNNGTDATLKHAGTVADVTGNTVGAVVTDVSADATGTVTVTRSNVKIPVGSSTATNSYADIWVE